MKITGADMHGNAGVNPDLYVNFVRGTGVSRAPFFGIDIHPIEKVVAVQNGAPDGRSGIVISRENGVR